MARLFKAFFFKISRDLTFRITLIVGAAFAVFTCLLYFLLEKSVCNGPNMLINTLTPINNFGIAVPVNLISFTVLEFTQGTIRNKIIAGNSKFKIYVSLFLTGLIFTLSLVAVYAGICTAFGCIIGGFSLDSKVTVNFLFAAHVDVKYIIQMVTIYLFVFIFLTSFAIFSATLFRNIGPCIPLVLGVLFIGAFIPIFLIGNIEQGSAVEWILKIVDPFYGMSGATLGGTLDDLQAYFEDSTFICTIASNFVYAALLFTGGALLFTKRDVK